MRVLTLPQCRASVSEYLLRRLIAIPVRRQAVQRFTDNNAMHHRILELQGMQGPAQQRLAAMPSQKRPPLLQKVKEEVCLHPCLACTPVL